MANTHRRSNRTPINIFRDESESFHSDLSQKTSSIRPVFGTISNLEPSIDRKLVQSSSEVFKDIPVQDTGEVFSDVNFKTQELGDYYTRFPTRRLAGRRQGRAKFFWAAKGYGFITDETNPVELGNQDGEPLPSFSASVIKTLISSTVLVHHTALRMVDPHGYRRCVGLTFVGDNSKFKFCTV